MRAAHSKRAITNVGVHNWRMPASSPDLNPMKKNVGLAAEEDPYVKDTEDFRRRRPPIGKTAFKARGHKERKT